MKKINLTKEFLIKEYIINKKSTLQIAKEVGCSHQTILRRLKKYNIPIRTIGEANKGNTRKTKLSKILTKSFLIKEYIVNKKSMAQIAKEIGCSFYGLYYNLKKCKIKIRTLREVQKSINRKGKHNSNYIDGRKCFKKYYCKDCGNEITYTGWNKGARRCQSCATKQLHRDNIFNYNRTPNKPEKCLNKLLNNILLKEYEYVGDNKVTIDTFNPDFINCNGQKKIIELYGNYWHKRPEAIKRDKRRIIAYKKYGYQTLIIWEHELKDLNKVENKILKFNNKEK